MNDNINYDIFSHIYHVLRYFVDDIILAPELLKCAISVSKKLFQVPEAEFAKTLPVADECSSQLDANHCPNPLRR